VAHLIGLPSDYFLFRHSPLMLVIVLAIRIILSAGCLGFILLLRRTNEPAHYDRWVWYCTLFIVTLQGMSAATRPPAYYGTFLFDLILILCCHLVIPNTLSYRLNSAVLASLLSLAILFLTREPAVLYMISIPTALFGANLIGLICSIRIYTYRRQQYRAIHETQQLNEQLTRLAETDPLTGINNRRKFIALGTEELVRFQRYGHTFSLAILDVDFFKQVNDRYGHATGDAVLRGVVRCALAEIRTTDSFGRLGGEEFGLLMPETSLEAAAVVMERIRQRVQTTPLTMEAATIAVTFSAGVIEIYTGDHSFDDGLRRADQLLYQAKQHGRNRVEIQSTADHWPPQAHT
jgi:diguanylate cyclase (GGDEF)-like protein